jgi:hypothetical protein
MYIFSQYLPQCSGCPPRIFVPSITNNGLTAGKGGWAGKGIDNCPTVFQSVILREWINAEGKGKLRSFDICFAFAFALIFLSTGLV